MCSQWPPSCFLVSPKLFGFTLLLSSIACESRGAVSEDLTVGVHCISAKLCFVCFLFGLTEELYTFLLMFVMKVMLLSFKCNLLYFIPPSPQWYNISGERVQIAPLQGWGCHLVMCLVISDHLSSKTRQRRWESYSCPKWQSRQSQLWVRCPEARDKGDLELPAEI